MDPPLRNHALLRQQGHFYLPSGFGQSGVLHSALHSAGNRFRRRIAPAASPVFRTGRHSVFYGGGRHSDFPGGGSLFTAHGTVIEGEVKTHRAFSGSGGIGLKAERRRFASKGKAVQDCIKYAGRYPARHILGAVKTQFFTALSFFPIGKEGLQPQSGFLQKKKLKSILKENFIMIWIEV